MKNNNIIKIYCDESCHIQNDKKDFMILGAVYCKVSDLEDIKNRIKEIRNRYNNSNEIKWNKISKSKENLYTDLINYFFDNKDLHFRCIIINKNELEHNKYNSTHDEFYYKSYFNLLKQIINKDYLYNIFIDIKDTKSNFKIKKLKEVLLNNMYDFDNRIIQNIQHIRSQESTLLQFVDLFIGAMSYMNNNKNTISKNYIIKNNLINKIKERSGYSLTKSTLLSEEKFNIFYWKSDNNL